MNKAGFIHINGEDDALLQSAEKLCLEQELRQSLGRNALELLKQQFSVRAAAHTIEKQLETKNAFN